VTVDSLVVVGSDENSLNWSWCEKGVVVAWMIPRSLCFMSSLPFSLVKSSKNTGMRSERNADIATLSRVIISACIFRSFGGSRLTHRNHMHLAGTKIRRCPIQPSRSNQIENESRRLCSGDENATSDNEVDKPVEKAVRPERTRIGRSVARTSYKETNGPIVRRLHYIECLDQVEGRDEIGQHGKTHEQPRVNLR
jgi:hypothetical protein